MNDLENHDALPVADEKQVPQHLPGGIEHDKKVLGIKTSNICPPIPPREFDWCAYYDGDEESGQYGYGRTERAAIDDLTDNWPR